MPTPEVRLFTNFDAFQRALAQRVASGVTEAGEVLIEEARLLAKRLIALTPPRNLAQGRRAIERDLMKSIGLMQPLDFRNSRLRKAAAERDYVTINDFMAKQGVRLNFVPFSSALHKQAQNARKRVPRSTGIKTLDATAWKRFLRQLQSTVGRAKGGWASAFIQLGGSPATWIRRQASAGRLDEDLEHKTAPYIAMTNLSGWAGSRGGSQAADTVLNTAFASRARNIAQRVKKEHALGLTEDLNHASRRALQAIKAA